MEKEEKKKFFSFFSRFHFLFPFPLKKEKEREKERKNGRKYVRFQGQGKEKDLVYQKGKQGLKLCGFVFSKR